MNGQPTAQNNRECGADGALGRAVTRRCRTPRHRRGRLGARRVAPWFAAGTRPHRERDAGCGLRPFHYGAWDPEHLAADQEHRLANELTMTVWEPVPKQPYFRDRRMPRHQVP